MIAEDLIARLEKVRKAGERSWSARCPAHADKGPSLHVTDNDGTILIHCFAGCSPAEIAAAAGINLSDLFPPRNKHEALQYRRERLVRGTLKELEHELRVALIILGDVENRRALDPEQHIGRARRARAALLRILRDVSEAAGPQSTAEISDAIKKRLATPEAKLTEVRGAS